MPLSTPPRSAGSAAPGRPARLRAALRGVAQTGAVVLAFVGLGLGAALASGGGRVGPAGAPSYTPPSMAPARVVLVDGFNVLHAGLLGGRSREGFWREEVRALLLARAAAFDEADAELWVVFDGERPPPAPRAEGRVHVVFAVSADEWLVRRVKEEADPSRLAVVTADRRLAARSRHAGAAVLAPAEFLARCAAG